MESTLAALALPALAALAAVAVVRSRRTAPAGVQLDALGVRRVRGAEVVEAIAWSELVAVHIATTDDGPFGDDFFWLLQAADGTGCAVSGPEAERLDLLGRLSRLPAFDHTAVVSACGSTENALFPCWRGAAGDGLAAAG
jgi:hypothetical protein